MPGLQLCSTDGRGYLIPLGEEKISIGRHPDNTLPLNDEAASRHHAAIEPDGEGGYRITDLGSRNGTKVNSHKLVKASWPLEPGTTIKIGGHCFAIEEEASIESVRRDVRSRTIDSDNSWLDELNGMLMSLPPKGEGLEPVGLIDSTGRSSTALSGDAAGPQAMRLTLLLAGKSRATDVHLEPKLGSWHLRFRVDGQMVHIGDLPSKVGQLALGLVKAACQMQPAAQDAVQDGRFSVKFKSRRVDYRVSVTPSVHGPKLVLRVLDASIAPRSLSELGLPGYMHERLRKVCTKEQGFVLVCGPTGSGKTTTLYNAMREIDRESTNVVTIEDPVEYQLEGTTQIPIDEHKGNTFNQLLRSVLRQDPDVILVGEIRDEETARTAMQAAMTGHLVFSTVHSKDSISAVFRLLDLKVEPFLVASSLDLVIAQRLVRSLCEVCKRGVKVKPGESTRLGKYLEGKGELFVPVGCAACLKTGYRGRRAVYEMLDFSDDLRDVILQEPTISAMKKVVERGIFTSLLQAGWQLAAKGYTDLEEVDRVAGGGTG
ncbi:MAG: Flp pilus assembly complex ATPase component TadA [Planctomycetaceae bacterium]|jgi:general secretion pathway protein E|nr:Flp pilus assembly complex ATPase component TadA [Phycisphaerales bacterium]MCE2654492.1 Flp pilus assembly complex ATPase component TadA [Planctomycetaceae bacterium]